MPPSGFLGQLPAGTPASCLAHLAPSGPVTKPSSRLYQSPYSMHRGSSLPWTVPCVGQKVTECTGPPYKELIRDADA